MSTMNNPGEFDCLAKLGGDEPFFILRAQDKLAPLLVLLWAERAKDEGVNSAKVDEAREVAAKMQAWPNRKLPD